MSIPSTGEALLITMFLLLPGVIIYNTAMPLASFRITGNAALGRWVILSAFYGTLALACVEVARIALSYLRDGTVSGVQIGGLNPYTEISIAVIATFLDGSRIGGWYGLDSFATSYPEAQQVYLRHTYKLDKDGHLLAPESDKALIKGCLIDFSKLQALEVIEVEEEGVSGMKDKASPAKSDRLPLREGYQPLEKGYSPGRGPEKPPTPPSGVSSNISKPPPKKG